MFQQLYDVLLHEYLPPVVIGPINMVRWKTGIHDIVDKIHEKCERNDLHIGVTKVNRKVTV